MSDKIKLDKKQPKAELLQPSGSRKKFGRTYITISRNTKKVRSSKTPIITGYTNTTSGNKLDSKTRKRVESFYIPPAYNNDNILVAKSASNKVQVICEDTAGRKQYIYHPQYLAGKEKRKYNKLAALAKCAYRIERDARMAIKHLASRRQPSQLTPYTKQELIQIVIYMLITYHFRIGCREYEAQYGSTGISTLRPKHIHNISANTAEHTSLDGIKGKDMVQIKFRGKKSVINKCIETWEPAIIVIKRLCKNHVPAINRSVVSNDSASGALNGYLFSYVYTSPIANKQLISLITSQDIACYLASKYGSQAVISPKMFRTWYANYHMLEFLRDIDNNIKLGDKQQLVATVIAIKDNKDVITDKQRYAWLRREIPRYVSDHLNNTPSVCRSDYINNKLFNEVLTRPDHYRKRVIAANTPVALHKLVGSLLAV